MLELTRPLFIALTLILVSFPVYPNSKVAEYLEVDQQDLLYLEIDHGTIIIQLADFFAPRHVARVRELTRLGAYNNAPFYRVIENFVVQGGPSDQQLNKLTSASNRALLLESLQPEFERTISAKELFLSIQNPEYFAEQTGFINGFPAGRSSKDKSEWLIHCPGTVNFTRSTDPASAQSHFAIMLGVSARHLDRNMTVVGRVISGWPAIYAVRRGPIETYGVFEDVDKASKIIRAYLGSDLPVVQQQKVRVQNPASEAFQNRLEQHRKRDDEFFVQPNNGNLDICYQRQNVVIESKKHKK